MVEIKFCGACGSAVKRAIPHGDSRLRFMCESCGRIHYQGPSVLVVVTVLAQDHVLLIKRGTQPYRGTWAPPGGFVESNESLQEAALREVEEECGLRLVKTTLSTPVMVSVPNLNQIHACFVAKHHTLASVRPSPPETTDAKWFTRASLPLSLLWAPAQNCDLDAVFAEGQWRPRLVARPCPSFGVVSRDARVAVSA